QGQPNGHEPPKEGPDHIVRLQANNIPAFQAEDFMPPANELKARVDFTYSDGLPEYDPAQFWKKRGKTLNGWVESFVDKRKAMAQALGGIVWESDAQEVE